MMQLSSLPSDYLCALAVAVEVAHRGLPSALVLEHDVRVASEVDSLVLGSVVRTVSNGPSCTALEHGARTGVVFVGGCSGMHAGPTS